MIKKLSYDVLKIIFCYLTNNEFELCYIYFSRYPDMFPFWKSCVYSCKNYNGKLSAVDVNNFPKLKKIITYNNNNVKYLIDSKYIKNIPENKNTIVTNISTKLSSPYRNFYKNFIVLIYDRVYTVILSDVSDNTTLKVLPILHFIEESKLMSLSVKDPFIIDF